MLLGFWFTSLFLIVQAIMMPIAWVMGINEIYWQGKYKVYKYTLSFMWPLAVILPSELFISVMFVISCLLGSVESVFIDLSNLA